MATLYEKLGSKYTAYGTPERTALAQEAGVANYSGSAEQNNQIISYLDKKNTAPVVNNNVNTMTQAEGAAKLAASGVGTYQNGTYSGAGGNVNTSTNTFTPAVSSSEVRNDLKTAEDKGVDTNVTATTSWDDYKTKIQPSIEKPVAPNYVDQYQKLREAQGLSALEDGVGKYDAQKAELLANLDKFKRNEMTGAPLGFAQGRISVEQQGIQDQLDFINRQENAAIDKINTKTKFIENIMNLTKDDYNTSNDAYNTEFNRNLSIQSQLSTEKNQVRDDSRATLTTINNMVSNSGKTFAELDPAMKTKINSLELQGGIPVGTFETFAASKPKANIISTSTGTDASGNDFVYFISKDPTTGELTTDKMYTGGKSSTPGDTSDKLTEGERKAFINAQIGTADFKALNDQEKGDWIRSAGGNPYDYQPY